MKPVDTSAASTPAGSAPEETWRELLTRVYLTIDRRTLGFTRILLGLYLICDLARRTPDWLDMFSDRGVLPTHVILFRPQADNFSVLHAFSTAPELWVLWAVILAAYVALLVGWHTKIAQVAALLFVTSMNGRVLLIENGGYVVQNLLVLWTCFMPLGDRFSVDALRASLARRRERSADELNDLGTADEAWRAEPFVSLVMLAVLLQLTGVYYFNVLHKTGPTWRDGTAVHYVLYNDRMATPMVGLVRDHLPIALVKFLTKTTMVFEAALPLCLLSPMAVPWARRAVVFMMCTLHIAFGATFTLGPFAWACCIFSTLMFSAEDWDLAYATMRRPSRARALVLRRGSRVALAVGRLIARLDRFELLTFAEAADVTGLFEIERPGVAGRARGGEALAEALAALPLGPLVAWIPRLPGVGGVLARLADRAASPAGDAFFFGRGAPRPASPPPSPLARRWRRGVGGLRELAIALMMAAAVNQALVELWVARPLHASQIEPLRTLTHKLRFLQGWFMFSPNPVMDDGILVCDAETVDGRHVDPFTGKAPTFVLDEHVQFNQIWQDYMNRIQLAGSAGYRDAMKAWILRYDERTGHAEDRVVAAHVVWISDVNPRIGKTESTNYQSRDLMTFDTRKGR